MKILLEMVVIGFFLIFGCRQLSFRGDERANPPAKGFNEAGSDIEAIHLADEVMRTIGGRKAWDATHYVKWNFFGRRTLTWDKINHRCRIEIPSDSLTILLNLKSDKGKVYKSGKPYTEVDSLTKYLKKGKEIWINDSYWLVMPMKLKDSGVTSGSFLLKDSGVTSDHSLSGARGQIRLASSRWY